MSLPREIYNKFAAIVGEAHISDKQHILAGNRAKTPDYPFEYKSAEAIVRPGSVEELQAVVKLCNKYGIIYAPMVSGVMPTAFATQDNTIIIQLSRMNKIVEINEEDRYVIIEPGVRHVQLYPELRKRGFSYTAASVGPGGSVLANFTSTSGDHHTQYGNSRANRYLYENHPIDIQFHRGEALAALEYRSKKELEGDVRIVAFPGADCCACCGTHVMTSGQVGLVKFFSCQKFREGVRIEMLCGERAFRALSASWEQNRMVSQMLSVKPEGTKDAVVRLQTELQNVKFHSARLEETVYASIAEQHTGAGDVLLIRPPMTPDSVRRLADAVAKTCGGLSAVFAGEDGGKYNYALVRADGGDISAFVKSMNGALRGRGGGRNGFAQGSVEAAGAEIEAFFRN